MRARLLALLAAALLAAGVSLAGATPALAAPGGFCDDNAFCLYQWKNYGAQVTGDRWQTSFQNIYNHSGHCLNIPPATWANGTSVADNSGSLEWYHSGIDWDDAIITYYNWANCNLGGGSNYLVVSADVRGASSPDLAGDVYPRTSISIYHSITSVSIIR